MCDTIVVVQPGRVLFAKNSDRDPNEAQLLHWQAAREHRAGDPLRCTWISIPQVARTHAVLLSRPYWIWGAEIGANEHGVVIGNEAVFTRAKQEPLGLTGMDLLRLALERSTTAAEAVEVIRTVLATHGQGGGCGHESKSFTYDNSYLVADGKAAFVVETAGRETAVEPVTSGARSISNGLTIPAFAARHADKLRGKVAACALRRALTERGGGNATTVRELAAVLRSHGSNAQPRYHFLNGTLDQPCMHGGGVVASSVSTASWIAELTPGSARHWATATAAPCLSLFKPVQVDRPVDFGPLPRDRADPRTLFWAQERLHRLVLRDPARLGALFLEERDGLESRWFQEPPASQAAFDEHRRRVAEWTERVQKVAKESPDVRPWFARRYWHRRERMAGEDHPLRTAWREEPA